MWLIRGRKSEFGPWRAKTKILCPVLSRYRTGGGGVRSAGRASRSDGFGRAEFLPKRLLELTGTAAERSVGNAMKFSVERVALERMIEQLKADRGVKGQQQRMMRLSTCAARALVEANGVAAGIEALVLADGGCNVPRIRFLKILRTYHPKLNVTIAGDAGELRIEGFVM